MCYLYFFICLISLNTFKIYYVVASGKFFFLMAKQYFFIPCLLTHLLMDIYFQVLLKCKLFPKISLIIIKMKKVCLIIIKKIKVFLIIQANCPLCNSYQLDTRSNEIWVSILTRTGLPQFSQSVFPLCALVPDLPPLTHDCVFPLSFPASSWITGHLSE